MGTTRFPEITRAAVLCPTISDSTQDLRETTLAMSRLYLQARLQGASSEDTKEALSIGIRMGLALKNSTSGSYQENRQQIEMR